jgi:hypothetical protein
MTHRKRKTAEAEGSDESSAFRACKKVWGFTYSQCGTLTKERCLEWFQLKFGFEIDYLIGAEKHKDGGNHLHARFKFPKAYDCKNCRAFDIDGYHPDILTSVGRGWDSYCAKENEFITNYYKPSTFHQVNTIESWDEACDLLWRREPRYMFLHASTAEKNFMKRRNKINQVDKIYFNVRHYKNEPTEWEHWKKSLVVTGKSGLGKTQYYKHMALHMFGSYCMVKGGLSQFRMKYQGQKCIIFDDLELEDFKQWDALFDVENGDVITTTPSGKYDYHIPCGIPRIFINIPGRLAYPFHDIAVTRHVHKFQFSE